MELQEFLEMMERRETVVAGSPAHELMRKNVFVNAGCKFQDHGGIYIGDNAIVAAGAVVTKDNRRGS